MRNKVPLPQLLRACLKSHRYGSYKAAEGRCMFILRSEANAIDVVVVASRKIEISRFFGAEKTRLLAEKACTCLKTKDAKLFVYIIQSKGSTKLKRF